MCDWLSALLPRIDQVDPGFPKVFGVARGQGRAGASVPDSFFLTPAQQLRCLPARLVCDPLLPLGAAVQVRRRADLTRLALAVGIP